MLPVNWAFLPVRGWHGGMQHINVDMGGLLIPLIASLSSLWPAMVFFSLLLPPRLLWVCVNRVCFFRIIQVLVRMIITLKICHITILSMSGLVMELYWHCVLMFTYCRYISICILVDNEEISAQKVWENLDIVCPLESTLRNTWQWPCCLYLFQPGLISKWTWKTEWRCSEEIRLRSPACSNHLKASARWSYSGSM